MKCRHNLNFCLERDSKLSFSLGLSFLAREVAGPGRLGAVGSDTRADSLEMGTSSWVGTVMVSGLKWKLKQGVFFQSYLHQGTDKEWVTSGSAASPQDVEHRTGNKKNRLRKTFIPMP